MKSIGDGKDTFVWADKWIFDEVPRRPMNKQRSYDVNLRVADLIGDDGWWKTDTSRELFPPNEVQQIQHILLAMLRKGKFGPSIKQETTQLKAAAGLFRSWLKT